MRLNWVLQFFSEIKMDLYCKKSNATIKKMEILT